MHDNYDYDVIIIGAGISGLVCGCYLAKAGLKTLIVEKNHQPGGYCTSFYRQGYRFDACVHYIGSIKNGSLSHILNDLGIDSTDVFNQVDPTDQIITPNTTIHLKADPYSTLNEFIKIFPSEKDNLEKFFYFVLHQPISFIYRKTEGFSLGKILREFFSNEKLISIINILVFCNMGVPADYISAFAAIIFLKEFVFDGGYYPKRGMQRFANLLVEKFREYNGEIKLLSTVEEVIIEKNTAVGVKIKGKNIFSRFVVSAIDATQLFVSLIKTPVKELGIVNKLSPSKSIFVVYLGTKRKIDFGKYCCNIWYFKDTDLNKYYLNIREITRGMDIRGFLVSFPYHKDPLKYNVDNDVIEIFLPASYESKEFWDNTRELLSDKLISSLEKLLSFNIREYIDVVNTATPYTLYRYTLNKEGAAYGWAPLVDQTNSTLLPQETSIRNLFLAGHWCIMGTGQGGISTVALSGKKSAERIINLFYKG